MLSKNLANSFEDFQGASRPREMRPHSGSRADLSYLDDPHAEPDAVQGEFSKGYLGQV